MPTTQISFAQAEYEKKKKRTRREVFLEKMENVVPWSRLMLMERGLLMTQGTLVDATLIAASSSTKNKERARDREMHQAKKGNQCHFGMKAHIGVDKDSGLVHTLTTTAANVSDISQTAALLHGQEHDVWADAGYVGVDKREDMQEALAANGQTAQWHAAKRRKSIEKLADG